MIGKKISKLGDALKSQIQFVAIQHGKEVSIPNGDTEIRLHDKVTLTGSTKQLEKFLCAIGVLQQRSVHEVMIVGGGKIIFRSSSNELSQSEGIGVKVIEMKRDRCLELVEKFPEITVYSWRWY